MPVYTVSQITTYLKDTLERDRLLADLYVNGEVSNLARSAMGHCYFTVKDATAQLRCVMFRPGAAADALQHGALVIVHGKVSLYPARGDVQIIADLVMPQGTGLLHLEFQRLKAKLEAEGLFDPSRKRPLPAFPQRIGVVTSEQGAVWHDIQTVVARRYPLAELVLQPTRVQGDGAAPEIVLALQHINAQRGIDVIIVARGGGSLEELWPFNEEVVARAIYASRAPVVSAIGHETDVTIADLVADQRAPTPSVAAEMVTPSVRELRAQVSDARRQLGAATSQAIADRRRDVREMTAHLNALLPDLNTRRLRLDDATRSLAGYVKAYLRVLRQEVDGAGQRLTALSPYAVLERGYAIAQRQQDGAVVSSVRQVSPGDAIRIRVKDGSFDGTVDYRA